MGMSQNYRYLFGVPIIRIRIFGGGYLGPPIQTTRKRLPLGVPSLLLILYAGCAGGHVEASRDSKQ